MAPYVTTRNIKQKTKTWLEDVEDYNRDHIKLNPRKSALLVIDMQNFFTVPGAPGYTPATEAVLPGIERLINAFRKARRPVIYTRHVHHPGLIDAGNMAWWWEGMCREGSPESEIHHTIRPAPDEKVILKHRYSAFFDTDLYTVLRCLKIEDVVICGVMTNLCCESTARDAFYRDFRVFFPADGNAAMTEKMHTASLLNLAVGFAVITTVDRLVRRLGV